MNHPVSKCCRSTFHSDCADEGTCCYVCDNCGKPCDPDYTKAAKKEHEVIK